MPEPTSLSADESAPHAPESRGGGAPRPADRLSQRLTRLTRWAMFVVALATPLLYLSFTQDRLIIKVAVVEILAVGAAAAWLLVALRERRLSYRRTPLNALLFAVAIVALAAAAFSSSPWASLWGSDQTGEKAASLSAFAIISFLVAATFRREDAVRLTAVLLVAFGALGVFAGGAVGAGWLGITLPAWLAANPVGTMNALALLLAAGFAFSLTLGLSARTSSGRELVPRRMAYAAIAVAIISAAPLPLIGFRMGFVGLALTLALIIAFNFTRTLPLAGSGAEYALGGTAVAVLFLTIALSLFFLFRPPQVFSRVFQPPLEVSPSLGSTTAIARRVLKEDPVLGLGPASFRTAFNRFRDPALNLTPFWQARFGHGFSYLATVPATMGLLGLVVFLAFALSAVVLVARSFLAASRSDPYHWAVSALVLFLIFGWFTYASNFTASLYLFLGLGLLAVLAPSSRDGPSERSWWRIGRRTILVEAPALNFLVSLVVVFASALALIAAYAIGAQFAAEVYFSRAAQALTLFGNADTAKVFLRRAIDLNPTDDAYHQGLAQAALTALGQSVAKAASGAGPEAAREFQVEFAAGIAAAQRAAAMAPVNPQHWFVLGQLYEAVIPFIGGADRAAADAYGQALANDPTNPVLRLARARVFLTAAEVAALQAGQTRGEERTRLEAIARETIGRARGELEEALKLKSDFAAAHFLLAQAYLREGNAAEATRKVEEAAAFAPQDIGIAFQLGFLYYRAGNFARAEREFIRAVAMNDAYSNARYFLGLIYDRRGDRDGALSQFEKIAALNPDNGEVRQILSNLRAGLPALTGIAPPPEARREVPLGEGGR